MTTSLTVACPGCGRTHAAFLPKAASYPLFGGTVEQGEKEDRKEARSGEREFAALVQDALGSKSLDARKPIECECGHVMPPPLDELIRRTKSE